jgi:tetratricopeptide (TPR) repeat protein
MQQAVAAYERVGGPEHPGVALSATILGMFYMRTDKLEQAQTQLERGRAILARSGHDGHRNFALNLGGLAGLLLKRGDPAAAEPLLRQALEIHAAKEGPTHVNTLSIRGELGHSLMKQGKTSEAIAVYEACLADLVALEDPRPWSLDMIGAGLAEAYVAAGRPEQLELRLLPVYEQMLAQSPNEAPWMLGFTLGKLLVDTDPARARPLVEAARAHVADKPTRQAELADIDAWLAKHPGE